MHVLPIICKGSRANEVHMMPPSVDSKIPNYTSRTPSRDSRGPFPRPIKLKATGIDTAV